MKANPDRWRDWLVWPSWRFVGYLIEVLFVALIIYYIIWDAQFFFREGRLPSPFYFDTNDTFMDWTNTAYYANNPGAYSQFLAVYPPISFDFLHIFTVHSCYIEDAFYARECDWAFSWVMGAFFVLNLVLIYRAFWIRDPRTAWLRTIALGFGLPMLYGLERGQLALPAFTFFLLANTSVLKSARWKWLCSGIAINFKPYLILNLAPLAVKRRWAAFEGVALSVAGVYLISYAAFGSGTPGEIVRNTLGFTELPDIIHFANMFYQPSYTAVLDGLHTGFPWMWYLGSNPVEWADKILPALNRVGQIGVALAFLAAGWRPRAVPLYRLTALSVSVAITSTLSGGYSEIFLFLLVFMERWQGPLRITALVLTYVLSISGEVSLIPVAHSLEVSYLSKRFVGFDEYVTLGEIVRPALMLLIEYALIAASLGDVWRARHAPPRRSLVDGSGMRLSDDLTTPLGTVREAT